MERLTEKTVGCFEYGLKNHKAVPGEFGTYEAFFDYSMAVKRLGHYEDTGLEPEKIVRLQNELAWRRYLDSEIPSCKVGDAVWFIRPHAKEITETTVEKLIIKCKGAYIKLACNAMYETSCKSIGKTVFLTREEAEAALKGGADKS